LDIADAKNFTAAEGTASCPGSYCGPFYFDNFYQSTPECCSVTLVPFLIAQRAGRRRFSLIFLMLPRAAIRKGTKVTLPALRSGLIEIIEIEMVRNSFPDTSSSLSRVKFFASAMVTNQSAQRRALKSPAADFGAPPSFSRNMSVQFRFYIRHLFGEGAEFHLPAASSRC